jgi:hypothetical protein
MKGSGEIRLVAETPRAGADKHRPAAAPRVGKVGRSSAPEMDATQIYLRDY